MQIVRRWTHVQNIDPIEIIVQGISTQARIGVKEGLIHVNSIECFDGQLHNYNLLWWLRRLTTATVNQDANKEIQLQ